jgi:hypothetical protein
MPLSTSSSNQPTARDVIVLLGVCALFCILLELATTVYFSRVSQMEQRRQTEYHDALAMRSLKSRQGASVLLVGNSLLLEGVNFPQLKQEVGSDVDLRRTVIENTSYLDWYYGLRRMFRSGAQPDVVVVMLNPIQLTATSVNGDYSAHFLVDHEDVLKFARDIAADRNTISSLALANFSFFYGTRAEIRTWIVGQLLPAAPHLFQPRATTPRAAVVGAVAGQRMLQLRDLCTQHGADLVVVLPPARQATGVDVILQAAAENAVKLLLPIAPGELPSSDYSDNFHLNSRGAGKFTPALAVGLRRVVSQSGNPGTVMASVSPSSAKRPSHLIAGTNSPTSLAKAIANRQDNLDQGGHP